jgi:two-component system nitrate/nitrite response regulator NarL
METPAVIRIVVADDHPIFRDGLKALLATDATFRVVGESGDGLETVQVTTAVAPDLLLLDVAMPRASGISVLHRIAQLMPSVRILLLTASLGRDDVLAAMGGGARGVVLKEHATSILFAAIRAVVRGDYWVDSDHVRKVIDAIRDPVQPESIARKPANRYSLTAREMQVIGGVIKGESNREIATEMEIREDTVKHHLSSIFDKVGVFSRVELAVFALHHGLIEDQAMLLRPTNQPTPRLSTTPT